MNFDAINASLARALRQAESDLMQSEVVLAKQVQLQTGCTWTEALHSGKATLERARLGVDATNVHPERPRERG